jgi:hypothetical protein
MFHGLKTYLRMRSFDLIRIEADLVTGLTGLGRVLLGPALDPAGGVRLCKRGSRYNFWYMSSFMLPVCRLPVSANGLPVRVAPDSGPAFGIPIGTEESESGEYSGS